MPSVEFYTMAPSAPCRTVEMVAAAVGVDLNRHPINLFAGEHLSESYVKLNPMHKVPFVVDGDLKLGESRAIAAYLVNKYAEDDSLYPKDPAMRAKVDELLYYDATNLYSAIGKVFYPRFRGIKELNEADVNSLKDVLAQLDGRIGAQQGQKFLLGDQLTIGDISMAATLTQLEVNEMNLSEYKHLVKYFESLKSSIPNYKEINEKAIEELKQFIKSKISG